MPRIFDTFGKDKEVFFPGLGTREDLPDVGNQVELREKCREVAREIVANPQSSELRGAGLVDGRVADLSKLLMLLVDPEDVEQVLLMLPEEERQHLLPFLSEESIEEKK